MNHSKRLLYSVLPLILLFTAVSCGTESNGEADLNEPPTYTFERGGQSSVSFTGQTTRIQMGDELFLAISDFDNNTEELLLQM
ncbi:MAG: DUF4856 domain-containing protein, partial [Balneolaceae bacterium]